MSFSNKGQTNGQIDLNLFGVRQGILVSFYPLFDHQEKWRNEKVKRIKVIFSLSPFPQKSKEMLAVFFLGTK